MDKPVIAVYANGLFGKDDPVTNDQQLKVLLASGLNDYLLFAMHVHENGTLYYNDTPIVTNGEFNSAFAYLKQYVGTLARHSDVWWSIGGWQVPDFSHIGSLLRSSAGREALFANLKVLSEEIPVSGFDVDMEESYTAEMQQTIVSFTCLVNDVLGLRVTYCPYLDSDFWLQCLADVYARHGSQIVQRLNVQCYAGGTGNTTAQWVADLQQFSRATGVDPDAFIVPSNWVRSDDGSIRNSPADIRAFFAQADIKNDAAGGFLWCTSELFESGYTAADYASAVIAGLGTTS